MAENSTTHTRPVRKTRHGVAATVAGLVACVATGACGAAPDDAITVTDWCWRHYRLAPPGALASDLGPESATDADAWDLWLGPLVDAPSERRDAHQTLRELIDGVVESGGWSDDERQRYRSTVHTEPTTATICETVGARIATGVDGALPDGWEERFVDPDDSAFSALALAELDR